MYNNIFFKIFIVLAITYCVNANDLDNEIFIPECQNENKQRVCLSPGCVQAASAILESLDESIDPCDDFYEFTCGNFVKNAVIPDDLLVVTKHQEIKNKIFHYLRTAMEEPIQPNEPRPFVLLKNFYNVCMDVDAIEKAGLSYSKLLLKELGGWPVLEGSNWNESEFDWKELIYKLRKLGSQSTGFIRMFTGSDVHNSSHNIILIDEGSVLLKKEFLKRGFNTSLIQAYYNFAVDYAVAFGADLEFAKEEIKNIFEFQIEFGKILINSEDRRNFSSLTNKLTVADLQNRFPSFPWLEYINTVIGYSNNSISSEEIVDVGVPSFIPKMEKLINETSKRVQANYLIFAFLQSFMSVQPQVLKNLEFKLSKFITGIQKVPPRWKECVIGVGNRMGIATAALYVRKYFNEKAKNNVIEMITDMKTAFVTQLKNLDWMDSNTQEEAIKKVGTIINHVAYPEELLDDSKIDHFYAKLEPADNYFNFHFNYLKFMQNYRKEIFRKPIDKNDWTRHASSTAVNAFYSPSENSIELPAGILQNVYFDKDRPQYLNYGGIGFIIGHEITHGFDDQGRQIDKDGSLVDWWTKETEQTFLNKTKCIIEQYANFTLPNTNITINGINTQGENIADNGGLKVAYLAYQSWVQRNGKEASLPGLKYTPNQLFWISVGSIWCSKERPELLEKLALVANHSPSNLRVIGPMQNSKYFSNDFNCPIGSNMNPVKKCGVW